MESNNLINKTIYNISEFKYLQEINKKLKDNLELILSGIIDGQIVILDGLIMGHHPHVLKRHSQRLTLISLLHHPLSEESGLGEAQKSHLFQSEMAALTACAGVITTSDFTSQQLRMMRVPKDKIKTVAPGTDPSQAAVGPHKHSPPRLLCVASIIPRKGLDTLVESLSLIRELDWECICAGSLSRNPSYACDIVRTVRNQNLNDRVLFTGECSSLTINKFYELSSIFVLPSRYEGYGMVLSEAASRGLPIVSTTGGAIPHTLKDIPARLVPPGDPHRFANALESALSEYKNQEGEAFSKRAVKVQNYFPNWETTATCFEDSVKILVSDSHES